jgi:hypothetical protein
MLDLIVSILFFWLFFKAIGLALKMTWGITKFFASLLFTVALPLLIGCLLFAGGVVILIPLGLVALAFGLLKACL